MKKIILFSVCIFIYNNMFSQFVVDTSMTPTQLVQNIFAGEGVTVSNITYTGDSAAIGSFSGGATTNLGIGSGIVMSTGMVDGNGSNGEFPIGSPASNFNSWIFSNTPCNDPQLLSIATDSIYDEAILQFDFVPSSDTIYFQYIFASEEYPEYVNSHFNDVFGFFISGPNPDSGNYSNVNIALIPGTDTMVSINNVNDGQSWTGPPTGPCMHCQYYVNNFSGTTIVYNGFTTVLPAQYPVVPYMTYHVKIGIADVGDPSYDSAIFLEASSLTTAVKDYSNANKMLLYPNPAINTLTIERPQSAVIEITNIQGQIIKTIAATGNKTNVDVSSFPCGMYIVEMKTDKGIEVKKFVKE